MNFFTALTTSILLALGTCALTAQSVTLIVTSKADDSNARDANPGDGLCSDFNGRCTLRAAVDEANASSDLDVTIVIPGLLPGSVSGKYTLSRVAPNNAFNTYEDENAYGDLDLNGSFASLRLQGTGTPGPEISISPNDRIIHVVSGGSVFVERIHFTGGTARAGRNGNSDNSGSYGINGEDGADGGAMYIAADQSVVMDQVTFSSNTTQSGGNGTAPASSISLIDGGNGGSGGNGGALFIGPGADVTIRRGTFTQNGTGDGGSPASGQSNGEPADGGRGGYGGNGGAIYNAGSLTLESCTITANAGGDPSSGAAGVNGGETGEDGEGGSGGGIAQVRLIGGEVVSEGSSVLLNNVIAYNRAGDDTENGTQPGTDFYDNRGGKTFTSQGYNLVGTKNASGAFRKKTGDQIGKGERGINPELNGLNQNADAAVPTMEPRSGSPVVNAGTTIEGNDYDARGFLRPAGGQADKGAHERNSSAIAAELVISDFNAGGSNEEFITVTNTGDYAAQMDDHVLVAFPDDYNDAGPSCYSMNLYGEIQPGETFTLGDETISPKRHNLDFDTRGPSCEGESENQLSDLEGAIGLYRGGAVSYQGFVLGNFAATRIDLVEYRMGNEEKSGKPNKALPSAALTVYPNPSFGTINLGFTASGQDDYDLEILDLRGAVLYHRSLASPANGPLSFSLDLSSYSSGVYFVRLRSGDTITTNRIIRR